MILWLGDALYHLRIQLSEATDDLSFIQMEKDPSEFLGALKGLFQYVPLKTIPSGQPPKLDESNITTNIICELFFVPQTVYFVLYIVE